MNTTAQQPEQSGKLLFNPGRICATPGAISMIETTYGDRAKDEVLRLLRQHITGDWPHDCEEDQQANREAVDIGCRVFTSWATEGGKLWIITEADRSITTLLLPQEY